MVGTVYNDKEGQASAMYKLAVTLARGGSINELSGEYNVSNDRYIRLPYTKVTGANVNSYLSK